MSDSYLDIHPKDGRPMTASPLPKIYTVTDGIITSFSVIKETPKTYAGRRIGGMFAGMDFRILKRLAFTDAVLAVQEANRQIDRAHEAAERAMDRVNKARAELHKFKARS